MSLKASNGYILPTVTNTYNVYHKGKGLIGLSSEITLPDFTAITEEIKQERRECRVQGIACCSAG